MLIAKRSPRYARPFLVFRSPEWILSVCLLCEAILRIASRLLTGPSRLCTWAWQFDANGRFFCLRFPLVPSTPPGAADMSPERTRGTLIKTLVLVLNSLLLERPAFISLAQQTTDTHRRLRAKTGLHSDFGAFVCVCVRAPLWGFLRDKSVV